MTFLTVTDYRPAQIENIAFHGNSPLRINPEFDISLLTWNIGYAGLGNGMDYFYDGGKRVRDDFNHYQGNLNGIYNLIQNLDSIDFILLQEVDYQSKRSYYTDQINILSMNLRDFNYAYCSNYEVNFLPAPLTQPIGKVSAGLLCLSRFRPGDVKRIASPVNFRWPKRVFFPDRCFLFSYFPVYDHSELVVINLHNSAWQEGEALRKREIELLVDLMVKEYQKGNYVIAGGDWNQMPSKPGFAVFSDGNAVTKNDALPVDELIPDGWQCCFDEGHPSNRDLSQAFIKGRTPTSIIDFFLLSPNIRLDTVMTLNHQFEFSDHNPVYLRCKLLADTLNAQNSAKLSTQ